MYLQVFVFLVAVSTDYDDLMDAWFPENEAPPSAYLVDTSEEALLLPDWLKLRMIRATSGRLVDAGILKFEFILYVLTHSASVPTLILVR